MGIRPRSRCCGDSPEIFVAGPLLMLLLQSITLLVGIYGVMRARLEPRRAAIATAIVFLFPPICGVTALIVKDALMAGFLMVAIALMLDDRARRHRLALVFLLLASLVRWNALAATCVPMVLLFRWRPELAGWRRYVIAVVAWIAVTMAAMQINSLLTTHREHAWYSSHAYMDIAGTIAQSDLDDAELARILDGVPLHVHDHLRARFLAKYNPADYRQLIWGPDRLFDKPPEAHQFAPMWDYQNDRADYTDAERAAIRRAWGEIVLDHPTAYLRYRWDNARILLRLDRPYQFSQVYVWFHVIAADETVDELEHDAAPGAIQAYLRSAAIAISNTPLYYPYLYLIACLLLLAVCRKRRLKVALLLSAIGYEAAWFFLDPTGDFRYSQWMVLCSVVVATSLIARLAWPR